MKSQNSDGGFGVGRSSASDADMTGAVLQALATVGRGGGPVADRAAAWLRANQNGDGGFGALKGGPSNAQSTAYAVQGLLAAGSGGGAVSRARSYLVRLQRRDGSVAYSSSSTQTPVWVTAQALMALEGKPLPLGTVARSERSRGAPAEGRRGRRRRGRGRRQGRLGRANGGGAAAGAEGTAPGEAAAEGIAADPAIGEPTPESEGTTAETLAQRRRPRARPRRPSRSRCGQGSSRRSASWRSCGSAPLRPAPSRRHGIVVAMSDPFAGALTSPEQLRDFYDAPMDRAIRKDIGHIDELCRRLIAASPMLFVATHSRRARRREPARRPARLRDRPRRPALGDPRRDRQPPPRHAREHRVERARGGDLPDPRPRHHAPRERARGRDGRPEVLDQITPVGKPPRTAIVVRAEEVYTHCPKAFVRSKLWDPGDLARRRDAAHLGEVSLAHQRDPELTLEQVQERERDALANRLE